MHALRNELPNFLEQLDTLADCGVSVIPWSSPVLSFGDLSQASVATLGLNPSDREFVDPAGNELDGYERRFHTLRSLGLKRWRESSPPQLDLILNSCFSYFDKNPYDRWFKRLDYIISGTHASYYNRFFHACHLDLIPYATKTKWGELTQRERNKLVQVAGGSLAILLRESPIRLLVLNGNSVVRGFQALGGATLIAQAMPNWRLPRKTGADVPGISFEGRIEHFAGRPLAHPIGVLGFNHNIQSSFGVTKEVTGEIQDWIGQRANKYL
jgi:hypothetical protein